MNRILEFLFGPKCPHCDKRSHKMAEKRYLLARGWNEYCQQASSATGYLCPHCIKVTWEEPDEDKWLEKEPAWIRLNGKYGKVGNWEPSSE